MAWEDWLRAKLGGGGGGIPNPSPAPAAPDPQALAAALFALSRSGQAPVGPAPGPSVPAFTPAAPAIDHRALAALATGMAPAAQGPIAPPATPLLGGGPGTGQGPSVLDDPVFRRLLTAGATPVEALTAMGATDQSGDPARAYYAAYQAWQKARQQGYAETAAAHPSPVQPAAEAVASAPLAAATTAADVATDAVTNPIDTGKAAVGGFLHVAGIPQHEVALLQAESVYRVAKGGTAGKVTDAIMSVGAANPVEQAASALGMDMNDWGKANTDAVIAAYERGYQRTDDQGHVIETIAPGREAVLAMFMDSMNFLQEMGYQTLTDPTLLIPAAGAVGRSLKGVTAAEDAGLVARAGAAVARGTGTALEAGQAASELPEQFVVGGARTVGRAVGKAPGAGAVGRFLTEASEAAKAEVTSALRRQALDQVAQADAFLPYQGINPPDAGAPFAGTTLDGAAPDLAAAVPTAGVTPATLGTFEVVEVSPGAWVVRDADAKVAAGPFPDRAQADAAAAQLSQTTPATALTDQPVKIGTEQSIAPEVTGAPILPNQDLRWLGPKRGGSRAVDRIAYEVGPRNPAVARAFYDAYEPLALESAARQDVIDQAAKNLRGVDRLGNRAEKVLEETRLAKQSNDLFQSVTGETPPPYDYRYTKFPEDLIPADGRWTPMARERVQTWWDGAKAGAEITGDQARGAAGDEFNALVERALGPDDELAGAIRVSLRGTGDEGAALADALKDWRAELYGPESVLSLEQLSVRRVWREVEQNGKRIASIGDVVKKGDRKWDVTVTFDDGSEQTFFARTKKDATGERGLFEQAMTDPTAPLTPGAAPASEIPAAATDLPPSAEPGTASGPAPLRNKPEGNVYSSDPISRYTDTLYREVRLSDLEPYLPSSGNNLRSDLYFSNDPALALGQGQNRGVLLELASDGISGVPNRSKPGWEFAWDQGSAEFIAHGQPENWTAVRQNLRSITIKADAATTVGDRRVLRGIVQKLEGEGWVGIRNADGSTTFRRAGDIAPEPGAAIGPGDAATGGAPPAPYPAEPERWPGQPVAGAAPATRNNPNIALWEEAKAARSLDEGVGIFEDHAIAQFGPRDASVSTGPRGLVYAKNAAGRGWKEADAEIDRFSAAWREVRGDGPNPFPSGRPPVDGATPFPPPREPLTAGTTPFEPIETIGGNRPAAPSLDAVADGITPAEELDPLRIALGQGDIDQAQFDLLNQTVDVGGKWTTLDDGTRALTGQEQRRLVDVFAGHLREGMTPDEAVAATMKALSPRMPVAKRNKLVKGFALLYGGLTTFSREHLMFNALTGARGILTDQLGDAWTQLSSGNVEAAVKSFDLRQPIKIYKDIRAGSIDAVARTDFGVTLDRLGVATPRTAGFDVGSAVGREEVSRSGEMAAHRFVEKIARGVGAGEGTAHRFGQATGFLSSEHMRDFRTAWDVARRSNIAEVTIRNELPEARRTFFDLVRERAAGEGVDAERLVAALGDEFSPKDVRRLAQQAGLDRGQAEFLARQWRSSVAGIEKDALAEVTRIAFDFAPTKADEVLKKVFVFHTWQSRAAPLYLRNTLRNPALASAYGHIADGLQRDCEARAGMQCGYLELWNTAAGYAMFGSPATLLSSALINLEPEQWQNPDATLLDRVLGKVPAMVNPVLQGIISGIGYSGVDAPDPLSTYTFRKTLGGVIDYGRAHGWFGAEAAASLGEPVYQDFLSGLQRAAYDWVGQHLPGTQPPKGIDPQARDNELVQVRIRDLVYAEHDIPLATPLDTLAAQYPQAAAELQEAYDAWQQGKPNEIANQAFRDYTEGNLTRSGAALLTPGGIRIRSETQDLLTRTRDRAEAMGATDLAADARGALAIPRMAGPTATNLEFGQAAVGAAGDANDRRILEGWNAIAFGSDPAAYLAPTGIIRYGDATPVGRDAAKDAAANAQITALSQDERRLLADQWVASLGPEAVARLERARTARDAAIDANPEEAAYRDWARGARDMGVPAFRDQMVRGNPNYRDYIAGYDDFAQAMREHGVTDVPSLDEYSVSRDAYLAYLGEKRTVYDAAPAPVSSPETTPYNAAATGGGVDGQPSRSKDPAVQLADDLRRYNTEMVLYNQALKSYTGNPNASWEGMNPQLREANAWHLAQYGISQPSMPASVARYQQWSMVQQANGKPADIPTYTRWLSTLQTALTGTGLDAETVIDEILNGRNPFAGTALGQPVGAGS